MSLLITDVRTRVALQLGLAVMAAEEARAAKEDADERHADAMARIYRGFGIAILQGEMTPEAIDALLAAEPEFSAWFERHRIELARPSAA